MDINFDLLSGKLGENSVTRFAPSPTGYLHLGHIASAIYVWGIGRAVGANILLRIEDHDRSRSRTKFEKAILDDLSWLGFKWDNTIGEVSDFRQSDCLTHYESALKTLEMHAKVYPCECSRKQILKTMQPHGELLYGGTCRDKGLQPSGCGLRVVMEDKEESFSDVIIAPQRQNPARQCGDLLVKDRNGNWTYHYAVVVDDLRQGVNLVVRGQDLTDSTGRQIALARRLGSDEATVYAHHPLITDESGEKLAKRKFSEAVGKRRESGESAESVLGDAAFSVGIIDKKRNVTIEDLVSMFGRGDS